MIFESQVVDAVARKLSDEGWEVLSTVVGQRKGDDIVARKENKEIRVEAKGESSENPTSSRYNLPFDRSQVSVHVAKAFFKSAATQQKENCISGIALPDNQNHRDFMGQISQAIGILQIWVFWISPNLSVKIECANQSRVATPLARHL